MARTIKEMIASYLGDHKFKSAAQNGNGNFTTELAREEEVTTRGLGVMKFPVGSRMTVFRRPNDAANLVLAYIEPPEVKGVRQGHWRVFCNGSVKLVELEKRRSVVRH